MEKLRSFWHLVSSSLRSQPLAPGGLARVLFNEFNAALVAGAGINGFFQPRIPPAFVYPPGSPEALSYYDTSPLRETLLTHVDFDRINRGPMRFSVGAVNVRTGNFAYFDNAEQKIGPEHIMASGALPPGFPPIEIDGEFYWDGGLVSNTPLQYVMEVDDHKTRSSDLAGRSRSAPAGRCRALCSMSSIARKTSAIPAARASTPMTPSAPRNCAPPFTTCSTSCLPSMKNDEDVKLLLQHRRDNVMTIVHLIYRSKHYESQSKDYEFSRASVDEHWHAGKTDLQKTVNNPAWQNRKRPESGVAVFDLGEE